MREDTRLRALRMIEANPKITQRQMAEALGISLGSTHYILSALAERGFVKLARFSAARNKRGYAYVLTPSGLTEKSAIAARFLKRKRNEYIALRAEIKELSAELGRERRDSEPSPPEPSDNTQKWHSGFCCTAPEEFCILIYWRA